MVEHSFPGMTLDELKELVFMALGTASMCWSKIPKGIFDSTKAKEVGDNVVNKIMDSFAEKDTEIAELESTAGFLFNVSKDAEFKIAEQDKMIQKLAEVAENLGGKLFSKDGKSFIRQPSSSAIIAQARKECEIQST